ncbi:MAG: hypothetical protein EOM12_00930 [Verrucomicrobiae bacterium]|nr:hypothetical protein [Verrucomicrobiae bacterium]
MDITFNCPLCEQELVVDSSYAGETIECPECAAEIVVPASENQDADAGEEQENEEQDEQDNEAQSAPAPTESQKMKLPGSGAVINAMASSAAAREHKTFTVPVHEAGEAAEKLIQKPNAPLEVSAKKWEKGVAVKTIRRIDCMEVGKDHFDDKVTEFINTIGYDRVITVQTIVYTFQDLATKALMTDFGVLIVYRIPEN